MNPDNPQQPEDYNKPVAYDANGQPLYAHPPILQSQSDKMPTVQVVRPTEPEKQIISEAVKLKHQQSKEVFPDLNLSDGEYVVVSVGRHLIGLILPVALGIFLIILSLMLLSNLSAVIQSFQFTGSKINQSTIVFPIVIFMGFVLFGMYVAYYVYKKNKLYLTNESVIQEIQTSIFARREKIVSLADIEDVSYSQSGIVQQIFNFGAIRLSTEGEGAVYNIKFVADPKRTIAKLSNAIEAFKNGRAVS